MPKLQDNSAKQRIIASPGDAVKGRVVAAGVPLQDLAAAASISRPVLSRALAGTQTNHRTQLAIWEAFRRLTYQRISMQRFWGSLLSKRIAG